MTDIAGTESPRWYARLNAAHLLAATAAAVVTGWLALGLPIAATRGYVEQQVSGMRVESMETRVDLTDLRVFMLDWTLRQGSLDPQSRSVLEAERARLSAARTSLQTRLDRARGSP